MRRRPRRSPASALPRAAFTAALAAALATAPAPAQEEATSDTLSPGARVRVTAAGTPDRRVGWLERADPDTLRVILEADHAVHPIAREAIRTLEVSRVRRSSWKQAEPGALAGLLVGAAVGIAVTPEDEGCDAGGAFCFYDPKLVGGLGGAMAGMLVGGLVSTAIVPAESWREVSVRLAARAGPRGASLTLLLPLPARRPR